MTKLNKLVVATFNKHKAEEIQGWFRPFGVSITTLGEFTDVSPEETGITFDENALIKAKFGFEATGLPTLADDSGLEVDALDGAPGVYSARFAGPRATDEENNQKLLRVLGDVPQENRTARFRCSMALVAPEGTVGCDGACEGEILTTSKGRGGFGYDPLFWLPELNVSMAELSQEEKNTISHRARALENLMRELKERGWL